MKKLLALVLALVMTLGLATVSSSAAYDDANDINYNEAVDVMTAVGVFQGKGSNFDPKANLNRAEAAKIVAYLMLGNDTAESIKGSGSKFTDVPADHWAAGYIEYLASAGVLSGVGGGKFDPNGQVTAIQLAKMLLVALGYDAEIEGFVGSDWSINIQKVANKVGIYDGNDAVVGNNPVTRDEAALYTFNTVKSPMVEYETTTTVNIGDANVKVGSNNWKYMTTASSSARYDNIDDAKTNDVNQSKIIEFGEHQWSNLVRDSSGDDGFGRAKVVWTYKGTTVGEYTDRSDLIFTSNKKVEKGAMYDLFGSNDYDKLEKGNASVQLRVFWDGVERSVTADNLSTYVAKSNTNASGMSGNGILTEVYRNDADITDVTVYTIIQITTYVAQATSDYNASRDNVTIELLDTDDGTDNSITLGNGTKIYRDQNLRPANFSTTIDAEDFPVVKNVKEDDYLLVTWSAKDREYGTVAVAEKLVGEVGQYKENDYVYIDGTKMDYNATVGNDTDNGKGVTYTIKEKATLVLDAYGYIIYVDEALTTSSYVYVGKVADNSKLGKEFIGDAYFLDGTNKSIVIKKIDNANKTDANDLYKWYTYTVNSDGEYTLSSLRTTWYAVNTGAYTAGNTSANEIIKNSTVQFMKNVSDATLTVTDGNGAINSNAGTNARSIKANSNTSFVVYDKINDDTTAYKGISELPDVTLNSTAAAGAAVKVSYAMNAAETYADAVFIEMLTASSDDTTDGSYTMLLKTNNNKVHQENTTYYEFDVMTDGELQKGTMIDSDTIALNNTDGDAARGTLLTKVKTNSDKYITSASEVGLSNTDKEHKISLNGKTISQSGKTITLAGESFVVTNSSKINMVIGSGATSPKLLDKIGDDYNLYPNTTIGTIAGMVNGYPSIKSGVAYVVTTDKNNDKIDVLYVFIDSVNAVAGAGNTPSQEGAETYATNAVFENNGHGSDIVVRYNTVAPSRTQISDAVAALTGNTVNKVVSTGGTIPYTVTMANGDVYGVATQAVYTVKVDGKIVAIYDSNSKPAATDTITLTKDAYYILASDTVKAAADTADTNLETLNTSAAGTKYIHADATDGTVTTGVIDSDISIVTAYAITADATLNGMAYSTDNWANSTALGTGKYVAVGTAMRATAGNAANTFAQFEDGDGNVLQSAQTTGVKTTADSATYTFTVSGDLTVASYDYVIVKAPGQSQVYVNVDAADAAEKTVTFTGGVATNAKFASVAKLANGSHIAAGSLLTAPCVSGSLYSYTAAAADAGTNGVIEIVQVSLVTAATADSGSTYKYGSNAAVALVSDDYYRVGSVIHYENTNTSADVTWDANGAGSAAKIGDDAANDTAAGFSNATTSGGKTVKIDYTIPATHFSMTITET